MPEKLSAYVLKMIVRLFVDFISPTKSRFEKLDTEFGFNFFFALFARH